MAKKVLHEQPTKTIDDIRELVSSLIGSRVKVTYRVSNDSIVSKTSVGYIESVFDRHFVMSVMTSQKEKYRISMNYVDFLMAKSSIEQI